MYITHAPFENKRRKNCAAKEEEEEEFFFFRCLLVGVCLFCIVAATRRLSFPPSIMQHYII
jgi:hypothetical protein